MRNLDTSLLRAFVAVAETGSMTVAGHTLHLTQAAVSQQIKRLEEGFGCSLFERDKRGMRLTNDGERLLGKAKRLLGLNDEIWAEMTTTVFKGGVKLGIPYDLVGTYLSGILKSYAKSHPWVEITVVCLTSIQLVEALAAGELDLALAEQPLGRVGGECLTTDRLVWVGCKGGEAFMRRPLPVAFGSDTCAFRSPVFDALRDSGIAWRNVAEAGTPECMTVTTQIDLAVTALLATTIPPGLEPLGAGSGLPDLPAFAINLHVPKSGPTEIARALAEHIRQGFLRPLRQAA